MFFINIQIQVHMQLIIFIMVSSCFAIDMDLVLKPKFFERTYVAHGKLKPQKTSQVASKMSGQIVIRSIDIGQTVRKDQLLFELGAAFERLHQPRMLTILFQ